MSKIPYWNPDRGFFVGGCFTWNHTMYRVTVPREIYSKWSCYGTGWMTPSDPEILSAGYVSEEPYAYDMEFTFDSEEMYQWFLLRQ